MTPALQESLFLLLAMVVVLATGVALDIFVDGQVAFTPPIAPPVGRSRLSSPYNEPGSRFNVRPRRAWRSVRALAPPVRRRLPICESRVSDGRAALVGVTRSGLRCLRNSVSGNGAEIPVADAERNEARFEWRAPMAVAKRVGVVSKTPGGIDITTLRGGFVEALESRPRCGNKGGLRRRGGLEMWGMEQVETQVVRSKLIQRKSSRRSDWRYHMVMAGREDLDEASALCIKVFFGEPDSPWKALQLRQLLGEQRRDLESRCFRKQSVMFKAVDSRCDGKMVGFVELSESTGWKYGMGGGIPLSDTRPVVSNLAVDPRARRCGIGSALMDACEDTAKKWGFDEVILQVEENNDDALRFYGKMDFQTVFVDKGARRYNTGGVLLQNVRCTKLTMRKVLDSTGMTTERRKSGFEDNVEETLTQLLGVLMRPFVARPPSTTRSQSASLGKQTLGRDCNTTSRS